MDDATATAWENQWYGADGGDGVMLSTVLSPELRKDQGMTLTEIIATFFQPATSRQHARPSSGRIVSAPSAVKPSLRSTSPAATPP